MSIDIAQLSPAEVDAVRSVDGDKVGSVGQVYLGNKTGVPSWVTVRTGLFGTSESFVPLDGARVENRDLIVGYDKDTIKAAPRVEADGALSEDEERELYRHYNLDGDYSADLDEPGTRRPAGSDVSGPSTDDAMTRSEERLQVGKQTVETGRARLRKYVVTEHVTQTVPVSHEEVRLVREPVTSDNIDAAMSGPEISEEDHEVVLHAERPVVETEVVPVERVRVDTETVTDQESVSADVRKEQITLDDTDTGRR